MKRKAVMWVALVASVVVITAGVFVFIMDVGFFLTKEESDATVISVEKPGDYKIRLSYYHDQRNENVEVTVKLHSSYKSKIENMGETVPIYYNKWFPHDVYMKGYKVPRAGLLVFEIIFLVIMCIAFSAALDEVRKKKST